MHKVLLLFLLCASVWAQDVSTDARMSRLTEQLRCLVCQNQTLEDSDADLAVDLRKEIRERSGNSRLPCAKVRRIRALSSPSENRDRAAVVCAALVCACRRHGFDHHFAPPQRAH
jgi:hypothetical protein